MSKLVESSINSHQCIIKLSTFRYGVTAMVTAGVCIPYSIYNIRIIYVKTNCKDEPREKKFSNGIFFLFSLCFSFAGSIVSQTQTIRVYSTKPVKERAIAQNTGATV